MKRIEEQVEVNCPVTAAYNQWTQFEDFPKFMEDRGNETSAWRCEVRGSKPRQPGRSTDA